MAMSQNEITVIGATRIAIGLSQVTRVVTTAFQYSSALKIISGGSLEIVPMQLSGTSTGQSLSWTFGYLIGANEVISWDGPATVYLAASGATVVAAMTLGYTSGATFL